MSYLLDTNVISELRKTEERIDRRVRDWIAAQAPEEFHPSAITILEIEAGIGRLRRREPERADRLQMWLEDAVLPEFEGRILPVDVRIARLAASMHVPDPRPERDALIAATAIAHGSTTITRNTSDFQFSGASVINPWSRI